MPKKPKKRPNRTKKGIYVELPPEVVVMLDGVTERTGRPRNAEVARAIRRHAASPEPPDVPAPLPEAAS